LKKIFHPIVGCLVISLPEESTVLSNVSPPENEHTHFLRAGDQEEVVFDDGHVKKVRIFEPIGNHNWRFRIGKECHLAKCEFNTETNRYEYHHKGRICGCRAF